MFTPRWVKSSYSANNGNCVEVAVIPAGVRWVKSSHSANNGDCVEVADLGERMAVRDSKNPDGPALVFRTTAFRSFLNDVAADH